MHPPKSPNHARAKATLSSAAWFELGGNFSPNSPWGCTSALGVAIARCMRDLERDLEVMAFAKSTSPLFPSSLLRRTSRPHNAASQPPSWPPWLASNPPGDRRTRQSRAASRRARASPPPSSAASALSSKSPSRRLARVPIAAARHHHCASARWSPKCRLLRMPGGRRISSSAAAAASNEPPVSPCTASKLPSCGWIARADRAREATHARTRWQ